MMPSAPFLKGLVEAITGFVQKISKGGLHGSVNDASGYGRPIDERAGSNSLPGDRGIDPETFCAITKATVFSVQFVRHEHTLSILVEDDTGVYQRHGRGILMALE